MAVAWAHQDCSRPLDQTEQRAEKIRQLRGQLTESERKLAAKEEELKTMKLSWWLGMRGWRGPKLRSGC